MMDKYSINVRVEMQELGPLPTTPAQPAEPTSGTEGQLAVPLPGPPVPVLLSPAPSSIAPTIADATPADAPSSDTPAKPSLDSLMDEVSAALAALKMVEGATSSPATVMRQATLEEMPAVVRTPRSLPGTGEAAKEVTPASDSKAGGLGLYGAEIAVFADTPIYDVNRDTGIGLQLYRLRIYHLEPVVVTALGPQRMIQMRRCLHMMWSPKFPRTPVLGSI